MKGGAGLAGVPIPKLGLTNKGVKSAIPGLMEEEQYELELVMCEKGKREYQAQGTL